MPHQATFALLCSPSAGAEVFHVLRVSRGAVTDPCRRVCARSAVWRKWTGAWRARQLMLCQTGTAGSTRASHGGERRSMVTGIAQHRLLTRVSVAAGIWGLCYAAYRGYYAGGRYRVPAGNDPPRLRRPVPAHQPGGRRPRPAVAAVLPVAMLPLWARRGSRLVLLALCWVVAVGCCMHALIDMAQRVLSLAGLVHIHYPPLWATVNDRAADLQDLIGNEPMVPAEGRPSARSAGSPSAPSGRGGGGRSAPWPRPAR